MHVRCHGGCRIKRLVTGLFSRRRKERLPKRLSLVRFNFLSALSCCAKITLILTDDKLVKETVHFIHRTPELNCCWNDQLLRTSHFCTRDKFHQQCHSVLFREVRWQTSAEKGCILCVVYWLVLWSDFLLNDTLALHSLGLLQEHSTCVQHHTSYWYL